MGIGDKFKDMAGKAKEKVSSEQGDQAAEQAGDKADEATGGKYREQVDKAQEQARSQTHRLDEP